MITHIRMKNFKSWADSGEVKLAPLTGFFGTNSSGKSSLLQMLLLLKQTAERKDVEEVIFFGDENSLVNLGNFREVIHDHQSSAELHLQIWCKLSHSFPDRIRTPFQVFHFAFDTVIREEEEKLCIASFQYRSLSSNTAITWTNNELSIENQKSVPYSVQNCYGLPSLIEFEVPKAITFFLSAFEELFSHIFYLGPTRIHPQRIYHWEGTHPESIGKAGEDMIASILNARVDQRTTPYEGQNVSIEERISAWLQKMELAYSFAIKRTGTQNSRDYEVRIQKSPNSANVTLADMGYGLSQFLPVLVHCYYAPEGSTLILEQPGIHLHPMVQSQLADLLIEVVTERKLQILVESHSEHLLTRLQRRIAEKQIDQNNVALYFCRNNEGVSTIEKLDVDESGDIKNWPENFFGDVMGDMFAMTDKQVESIAEKGTED